MSNFKFLFLIFIQKKKSVHSRKKNPGKKKKKEFRF